MVNILITGGNRGLGKALAIKLAKSGYHVLITARSLQQAQEASLGIRNESQNQNVQGFQLETSDNESIKHLAEELQANNIHLDVLVNNAAVSENTWQPHPSNAEKVYKVNYYGVINTINILRPLLTKQAKILVISSGLGLLSHQPKELQDLLNKPHTEEELNKFVLQVQEQYKNKGNISPFDSSTPYSVYSSSKTLINAYIRYVLSQNVEPQQTVYAIDPGWCRTDMGGQNAPCSAEDGTIASFHVIHDLPFYRNEKHGKGLNQQGQVVDY